MRIKPEMTELSSVPRLIQTPQGEKGALLGTPRRIAIGLYELDVLTGTGASDLDEHATTINFENKNVNKEI